MNIEQPLKKATGLDIKTFIEKAIEGGWTYDENAYIKEYDDLHHLYDISDEKVILDPSAWRAVGKVQKKKGDSDWFGIGTADIPQSHYSSGAKRMMQQFITNLWEYEE